MPISPKTPSGRQRRQQAALAVLLQPDVGLALDQDVEPVRHHALPRDDVAAGERRVDEPFGERLQLLLAEGGEDVDAAQRLQAARQLALHAPPRGSASFSLIMCTEYSGSAMRMPDRCSAASTWHAHRGVGGVVGARVGQPVAQGVAAVVLARTPSARSWAPGRA
jgi:hypothetical protein